MINMMRLAVQLKPFNDFIEEYDRRNTYRPDYPAEKTIVNEGDAVITFQHIDNLSKIYKELVGD